MMELGQAFFAYMLASFFTEMAFFLSAPAVLGYPIRWKKILLVSVIVDLSAVSVIYYIIVNTLGRTWMMFLTDLLALAVNTLVILAVYERDLVRGITASCIGFFCYYQIYTGSFVISSSFNRSSLFSALLCAFLCWGMAKLFYRIGVSECLEYFTRKRSRRIMLLAVSVLLAESYYIHMLFSSWISGILTQMPYQTWILTVLFLFLLLYVTFYTRHKQKEELQDMILMQQQMYIGSLEELQKEVRMYRHDYKNMISGVVLKAKEGNTEGVMQFLEDTVDSFEATLGRQILQTTHLANLHQAELKSLILSKLARMQELGICCRLEVMRPVKEPAMNAMDLNRCVGILVDNAIEAASDQKDGKVTLVFSQQEEGLTILVGNTIQKDVDVKKIFQEGYSTKGKNRGLGLASLERILKKYENAASMTRVQGKELIQELKIS